MDGLAGVDGRPSQGQMLPTYGEGMGGEVIAEVEGIDIDAAEVISVSTCGRIRRSRSNKPGGTFKREVGDRRRTQGCVIPLGFGRRMVEGIYLGQPTLVAVLAFSCSLLVFSSFLLDTSVQFCFCLQYHDHTRYLYLETRVGTMRTLQATCQATHTWPGVSPKQAKKWKY